MPYKVIGGKPTQVKYSSDEVFARIKHEEIKFIDLQFTSLPGRFHHTTLSADTFTPDHMEDGHPKLDGSSIVGFTSIHDSDLILKPDFYGTLSQFLGKLKIEEYDGIEKKTKNTLVDLFSSLTSLLINSRLEKISSGNFDRNNLLDEEKFIMDSDQEMNERKDLIIHSVINGKSKLVESISNDYKTKPTVIRFLKNADEILCVNSEKYGPFKEEDIATLPNENAQELISNKIATKIRLEE